MTDIWVCIASGPSLTKRDVDYCRSRFCRIGVTNTSWELAPDADLLMASDLKWWEKTPSGQKALRDFEGEKWCTSSTAARKYDLKCTYAQPGYGYNPEPGKMFNNKNSGGQLIQLAGMHGAGLIILLGYDMKRGAHNVTHWHGDHPNGIGNCPESNLQKWAKGYEQLAEQCPITILNATRDTALTCFPRVDLREIL